MPEEIFPIVDEDGNQTGLAPRSVCHDGKSMLLHPVVHLLLYNAEGELYLQKRSMTKDIQPGKWDTSVGGHVSPGEDIVDAVIRESSEELGIAVEKPVFEGKYIWQSDRERELVYTFSATANEAPLVNRDEIDEGRFWKIEEISSHLGRNIFTPNFENEFRVHVKRGEP
ncbi:MAG TPA: NUDIX domain-containing protein [Bacteroidales bacterium]|nr:NUDIX domain-containing protein [Bacteroidales bacterium]